MGWFPPGVDVCSVDRGAWAADVLRVEVGAPWRETHQSIFSTSSHQSAQN